MGFARATFLDPNSARTGRTHYEDDKEKESENDPLYNTSVLIGAVGVIGKYRKCNLWDAKHGEGNEHLCWKRGTELVVSDSPLVRLG